MKYIPKLACAVSLCFALLSCGEELFDAAKRSADGYPLAAVLVNDGGAAKMIVTDGGDYYKESVVNGMSPPSMQRMVFLHQSGAMFTVDGASFYSNLGSDGWSTSAMPGAIVNGIVSEDNSLLVLLDSINLYRFSPKDSMWSFIQALGTSYSVMKRISEDEGIYLITFSTDTYIYRLQDTVNPEAIFTSFSGTMYFDRKQGIWYAANTTQIKASNQAVAYTISPGSASSWVVIDSVTIFAIGENGGNAAIFKLDTSTGQLNAIKTIGSPGTVVMDYFDSGRFIVGIANGTDDGLYLYEYSTNNLTKILSVPVYGLHVARRR